MFFINYMQHSPRSWIEANFQKRDCVKFIPSLKDENKWVCLLMDILSMGSLLRNKIDYRNWFLVARVGFSLLISEPKDFFRVRVSVIYNLNRIGLCIRGRMFVSRANSILQLKNVVIVTFSVKNQWMLITCQRNLISFTIAYYVS